MDSIYELTKRSLAICQDRVTVQRNKVHYRNLVLTDFDLVGEIDLLKKTIAELKAKIGGGNGCAHQTRHRAHLL